ncbi:MAG: hypothetical protein GKR88_08540 [Flavobacteriaceae bacterium]|nr:MAG: hypothetical protein GKR88_08540 [Flavobacteriaceae bacterium]
MKTFAKLKFWSFLIFGILFLFAGIFFFVSGKSSEGTANVLMIAGIGQLIIFYGLLFYLYKGKLKDALNN